MSRQGTEEESTPSAVGDPPLRALVVGGHPVIRGIVRLACGGLASECEVTEAATLAEATALIAEIDPDVLIVDLELADGDGLALLRHIRHPQYMLTDPPQRPRILVLSDREDGGTVLEAMRVGAAGILTKSDGLRGLTTALRVIVAGDRLLPPALEANAIAELGRYAMNARESARAEAALTPREREVLAHVAEGLTIRQIGRRIGISPRTVESHVAKLYRKLGARSRLQAVSRAAALGLIELR